LRYAQALTAGPLFPAVRPDMFGSRGGTATKLYGRWVRRTVGITDRTKDPAHAWRHRFEDQTRRAGVPQNVTDGLMGHLNAANEWEGYGRGFRFMPDATAPHVARDGFAAVLMKLPRLQSAPSGPLAGEADHAQVVRRPSGPASVRKPSASLLGRAMGAGGGYAQHHPHWRPLGRNGWVRVAIRSLESSWRAVRSLYAGEPINRGSATTCGRSPISRRKDPLPASATPECKCLDAAQQRLVTGLLRAAKQWQR
jgi:hypothetical protein